MLIIKNRSVARGHLQGSPFRQRNMCTCVRSRARRDARSGILVRRGGFAWAADGDVGHPWKQFRVERMIIKEISQFQFSPNGSVLQGDSNWFQISTECIFCLSVQRSHDTERWGGGGNERMFCRDEKNI